MAKSTKNTKNTTKKNTKKEGKESKNARPVKNAKAKSKTEKTARPVKVVKAVNLAIAPSRVSRFINANGVNQDIEQRIKTFKTENEKVLKSDKLTKIEADKDTVAKFTKLLAFRPEVPANLKGEERAAFIEKARKKHESVVSKAVKSDKNLATFKKKYDITQELANISHDRKRFSKETYTATSVVLEEIARSVLLYGMDEVLNGNKRMVQPKHCVTAGIDNTEYFCLFGNTHTFRNMRQRCLAETEEEGAEDNDDASEEEVPNSGDFEHYISRISTQITRSGKKDNKYEHNCMSKKLKRFLSMLIIEIVGNLGRALTIMLNDKNAKTITPALVKTAFSSILQFNGVDPAPLMEIIDKKIEIQRTENAARKSAKGGKEGKESGDEDESESDSESGSESSDDTEESDESSSASE